ncbi:MAG: chorismate mutase [Candidatus Nanopelagicales bacterium]|nr:chorismate mutase [Candidatus Nanopelagicales bacterium]
MRAIRGAVCLQRDDAVEMLDAVGEMLTAILERNAITTDDLVSVLFTCTPDLHSGFPAAAARVHGFSDVPLMCAQEIDVVGALERCVRVMIHADIDRPREEIKHVYIRGAEVLRPDVKS